MGGSGAQILTHCLLSSGRFGTQQDGYVTLVYILGARTADSNVDLQSVNVTCFGIEGAGQQTAMLPCSRLMSHIVALRGRSVCLEVGSRTNSRTAEQRVTLNV